MRASGHKLLVHAADIVSGAILSIRQLTEGAQESRKKDSCTSEEVTRHQQTKMFSFTSGFLGSTYLEFEKTV